MTRSSLKVTEVQKLLKLPISKSVSSVSMHIIKRLPTVNYDTPRHYLNFNWADFSVFILIWCHMTFKFRVFHLQQMNFTSYEELTSSPIQGLFIWHCCRHVMCLWQDGGGSSTVQNDIIVRIHATVSDVVNRLGFCLLEFFLIELFSQYSFQFFYYDTAI